MIKKLVKTTIYLLFDIVIIILITVFLKLTLRAYQNGLLVGLQYYMRIFYAIIIYLFTFVHILLLMFEHTNKRQHSILWELISLIILFVSLMATIL